MNRTLIALAVVALVAWACFCGWVGYQHGKAGDQEWLENLLAQTTIGAHW
jgi:hypothetical protein